MWRDINEKLQICLIKGGLTEAMILYNTTDYDHGNKMVKFIDGKARSKEAFYVSGFHPDIVDGKFYFLSFLRGCSGQILTPLFGDMGTEINFLVQK